MRNKPPNMSSNLAIVLKWQEPVICCLILGRVYSSILKSARIYLVKEVLGLFGC